MNALEIVGTKWTATQHMIDNTYLSRAIKFLLLIAPTSIKESNLKFGLARADLPAKALGAFYPSENYIGISRVLYAADIRDKLIDVVMHEFAHALQAHNGHLVYNTDEKCFYFLGEKVEKYHPDVEFEVQARVAHKALAIQYNRYCLDLPDAIGNAKEILSKL